MAALRSPGPALLQGAKGAAPAPPPELLSFSNSHGLAPARLPRAGKGTRSSSHVRAPHVAAAPRASLEPAKAVAVDAPTFTAWGDTDGLNPAGKRTDLKRIMILGAGPIVIGQACEFDYSGTQVLPCEAHSDVVL